MITPLMPQIVKVVPRKTESHLPSIEARTFRAESPRGGPTEASLSVKHSSLFKGQAIQQTPSILDPHSRSCLITISFGRIIQGCLA